jgi:hypothetical protein
MRLLKDEWRNTGFGELVGTSLHEPLNERLIKELLCQLNVFSSYDFGTVRTQDHLFNFAS